MSRLPATVRRLPLAVRVTAAVEKLPRRERQVLSLMLLEHLTPLEAAGALRLSARVVEHTYANALETIARESGAAIAARPQRRAA